MVRFTSGKENNVVDFVFAAILGTTIRLITLLHADTFCDLSVNVGARPAPPGIFAA